MVDEETVSGGSGVDDDFVEISRYGDKKIYLNQYGAITPVAAALYDILKELKAIRLALERK